jgi:hypothetical protein
VGIQTKLPLGEAVFGAWAQFSEADANQQQTCLIVSKDLAYIGYYKSTRDDYHACDLGLSFSPDGKATLQYRDKDGKTAWLELPPLIAGKELQWFLESLYQRHVEKA